MYQMREAGGRAECAEQFAYAKMFMIDKLVLGSTNDPSVRFHASTIFDMTRDKNI